MCRTWRRIPQCCKTVGHGLLGLRMRSVSLFTPTVNQLREVGGAHQPRRLLAPKPKCRAWEHLRSSAPACLFEAESEVLGCDASERNIRLAELGQQSEVGAIHRR